MKIDAFYHHTVNNYLYAFGFDGDLYYFANRADYSSYYRSGRFMIAIWHITGFRIDEPYMVKYEIAR